MVSDETMNSAASWLADGHEAVSIIDFLEARISEDEEIACAALQPIEMHPYGDRSIPQVSPEDVPGELRGYLGGSWGEHAANWAMPRVLAECASKRAILEMCVTSGHPPFLKGKIAPTWPVLTTMAAVYADHPDFDPAWKIR